MEASQNGSSEYGRTAPVWPSNIDMQRGSSRSPSDMQKMKPCHNAQCGVFDGMSVPVANGHCQQSSHGRLYPAAYLQQQQQHPMAVRAVPQQHHHQYHHPSSIQSCHPHQAQSYASAATSGPVPHPHMDRMMHGPVAASPQMRSIVMNHYPATGSYPYPHNSAMSSSGYYAQAVANASASGNGPMDYSHPGNGAAQYAQHQRTINAIPTSSANSYRPVQNLGAHTHSKVMNPSQAALYQNAYHQYAQYIQQQGLVHPQQAQHHQNGPTTAALNMTSHHHHQQQQAHQQVQQTRLLQYMSRVGQPVTQHHHHNHVYSTPCHSHMMPNCTTQPQPLAHPQPHVAETVSGHSTNSEVSSINKGGPAPDENCKSSTSETIGAVKEKQPPTETDICKENCCPKTPLVKIASVKLKCRSPAETIRIKATKSATRLRDRLPKLVLGRKKKSAGTGSSSVVSGGKKLKSYLKVSSSSTEAGCECASLEKKPSSTKNPGIECVHAEPLCKTRPPPGFEHLIRPAFPIEMCDPTLLGTLIGCQLSREGLLSESVQQCFGEELEELLAVLPCCGCDKCDKEGVDVDWESEKLLGMEQDEDPLADDWETLNKAIRSAVDEWTEELNLLGRFQIILQDDLSLKSINLFKNF